MSYSVRATSGKVVSIHYTLTSSAGEVIDSSGDDPLDYLHGGSNIIPGLERQIEGRIVGDKFQAVVPPEEGYGPRYDDAERALPRAAFPQGALIEPGSEFTAETDDGEMIALHIVRVEGEKVFVDTNHPLAGETLTFDVEVVGVRDATDEESAHGHAHGGGCCH